MCIHAHIQIQLHVPCSKVSVSRGHACVINTASSDNYHLRSTRQETYIEKAQQNSSLTCSTNFFLFRHLWGAWIKKGGMFWSNGVLLLINQVLKGYRKWEIKVTAAISHLCHTSSFLSFRSVYFPSSLIKHCAIVGMKLDLHTPHRQRGKSW